MARMRRILLYLVTIALLAVVLLNRFNFNGDGSTADDLLPDLADYRQVEGESITGYIGALSEGAALLAGQPHLAAAVGLVDQVVLCYQEVGAVQARAYSHRENPLSAGIVAIADESELTDPATMLACASVQLPSLAETDEPAYSPCSSFYRLDREDQRFYIAYAASTADACADFCSNLDGCMEQGAS